MLSYKEIDRPLWTTLGVLMWPGELCVYTIGGGPLIDKLHTDSSQ